MEDIGTLEESSVPSLESLELESNANEDIWIPRRHDECQQEKACVKSWEAFAGIGPVEKGPVFLSEAGPAVFDAYLVENMGERHLKPEARSSGLNFHSEILLTSLKQLCMGRESLLFHYVADEDLFQPRHANFRTTGHSLQTITSLSRSMMEHAYRVKKLHAFATTVKQSEGLPTLIALASGITSTLVSFETDLVNSSASIHTLLQLQAWFQIPQEIVLCMEDLVDFVSMPKSDVEVLSKLFGFLQDREQSTPSTQAILPKLFKTASVPWLQNLSRSIGLKHHQILGLQSHTKEGSDGRNQIADYNMPSFVSAADTKLISETKNSLSMLQNHHPDHPILKLPNSILPCSADLSWQVSWPDIERVATKAKEYQQSLIAAVERASSPGRWQHQDSLADSLSGPEQEERLMASAWVSSKDYIGNTKALFERPLESFDNSHLSKTTYASLQAASDLAPPASLLFNLSVMPMVSAQSRVLDRACLQLILRRHNLRAHLSLLHRFTLMTDGTFTSRLCQALFDPTHAAQGYSPQSRQFKEGGLALGFRKTWPPATSELQLALMGILSECYFGRSSDPSSSMFRGDLPGGMSFAIREMSENELQRCLDPDSLYALDFLKMQYQPPKPLDEVISTACLAKYDVLSRLLLRVIRVQHVVQQLSLAQRSKSSINRNPRVLSMRMSSHHFVSTLYAYLFGGVIKHVNALSGEVSAMEISLDERLAPLHSIHRLREFHENLLDELMTSCLLGQHQRQILAVIEDILGLILRYARIVRDDDRHMRSGEGAVTDVGDIHQQFRSKVRSLIEACRIMNDEPDLRGTGGIAGADGGGGSTISRLLLRLTMNGYYME